LLPIGHINDVETATALWEGFAVVLLLLILSIAVLQKLENESSLLPILIIHFLFFFTLLTIFQGQITALALASLSLGYYAYRGSRHPDLPVNFGMESNGSIRCVHGMAPGAGPIWLDERLFISVE